MGEPDFFISVIIPCLNEEGYIGGCLDSVIAGDYPQNKLEIIVVDGNSLDGTKEILEKYARNYRFVKVLDNPKKITPAALNLGIKAARGEIIVRMDSHSAYEKEYLSKCVKYLKKYKADNVGGKWITVPRDNSILSKAITASLSHSFGVGRAHYRIGQSKEPRWVDTVPYGCFRRELFDKIGFFDETSPRNEDIEFNKRLRKAGGKILLVPDITIKYYARSSFRTFCKHNLENGVKVTHPFRLAGNNYFSWRHLAPLAFVLSLITIPGLSYLSSGYGSLMLLLVVGSYALLCLNSSREISVKNNDFRYLFLMPVIFSSLHITYGLGSLWGLVKSLVQGNRSNVQKSI